MPLHWLEPNMKTRILSQNPCYALLITDGLLDLQTDEFRFSEPEMEKDQKTWQFSEHSAGSCKYVLYWVTSNKAVFYCFPVNLTLIQTFM